MDPTVTGCSNNPLSIPNIMNELYNETIVRNGKTYRYDPDYDCYYREYTKEELSHWGAFGWIYCILALAVMCYVVETVK